MVKVLFSKASLVEAGSIVRDAECGICGESLHYSVEILPDDTLALYSCCDTMNCSFEHYIVPSALEAAVSVLQIYDQEHVAQALLRAFTTESNINTIDITDSEGEICALIQGTLLGTSGFSFSITVPHTMRYVILDERSF